MRLLLSDVPPFGGVPVPRTLSLRSVRCVPWVLPLLLACSDPQNPGESPDPQPADPMPMDDGRHPPDAAMPVDAADPPDAATPDLSMPPRDCKPQVQLSLAAPLAELRSPSPLAIEVTLSDSGGSTEPHPLSVVLAKKDGTVIKKLFDGQAKPGKQAVDFVPGLQKDLPTGELTLKASLGCPMGLPGMPADTQTPLYLVRLGVTQIHVQDGEGGGRVPLLYHAVDKRAGNYFPVPTTLPTSSLAIPMGEPELDKPDGTPRSFPAKPWDDLVTPPVDGSGAVRETGETLPVSLRIGTKPDLLFTIGKTAQSMTGTQPSGLAAMGLPVLRLVVSGVPGSDTGRVKEGGQATVRMATSPVPSIQRVDTDVKWHFEWQQTDGSYAPIADSEGTVTLRFYGVLGNEQGKTSPNLPWVAVVDEATGAIAGTARDANAARAALVQHVYEKMGLTYDRRAGASVYTRYSGTGGWGTATFSLAEFLKRSRGRVVNCSDCGSILSTYANMIGAKSHYAIIGWSFKLNPILGIGATMFGSPFDSGRLGFSYHAVTSPDATLHIDDATLAVDGDMDPTMAPHTKLLVQGLTGADYLTRLSPTFGSGTPDYQYKDQITNAR